MDLTNILIALRTEKGVTKKTVSDATEIPYTTYIKYESGERKDISLPALIKIADFYNVSLDFITGRTSIREMNTQDKWLPTPEEVEAVEQKIIDIYTQLSPKLRRAGIGMLMDIIGGFMPDLSRITAALEEEDDEQNENPA
jgi:transcriptional regulator with XRE-family HTH domain